MNEDKEFQVTIRKPDSSLYHNSAQLDLPATWAEVQDAMEIARIEDGAKCRIKIDWTKRRYLDIQNSINLYDLNLLAQRLAVMDDKQASCFEAMVQIDTLRQPGISIPLPRLINMSYSTENCTVISNISDDEALGRYLCESIGTISPAERTVADEWDSDEFYSLLGQMYRENGVYTEDGCYIKGGEIKAVYTPGEMCYFDRSGAPVVLEITNLLNENGLIAVLDLPACDLQIQKIAESVKADSINDCGYRCRDCLVPMAKDMINNADDFEYVKEFAQLLHEMTRREPVAKYKALLAATGCIKLEDACELGLQLAQYDFRTDILSPEIYGDKILRKRIPELVGSRFEVSAQFYGLGEILMERHNKVMTDYGMISRKDGLRLEPLNESGENEVSMGGPRL